MLSLVAASVLLAPSSIPYSFRNVEIVGGGFVSGLVFHPKQKDLVYARTDIGGAYRLNPKTRRWVPLMDWISQPDWNLYGVESIGIDPTDPRRLYLALGTYTNGWAGNGAILRSTDQGRTFKRTDVPFKLGGNEDGRSMGERLAVDPNMPNIVFFGSRRNGLWRSEDYGATWIKWPPRKDYTTVPLEGPLPSGAPEGIGAGFIVFDPISGYTKAPRRPAQITNRIYLGGVFPSGNLLMSPDTGNSWQPVPGQPPKLIPHHAVMTPDGTMYITYGDRPGPNGMTDGAVWKLETAKGTFPLMKWTDITPVKPNEGGEHGFGYAGLSVDAQRPDSLVVSTMDRWNPGDDAFRSEDGGKTWKSLKATAVRDSSLAPFLKWGRPEAEFGHWIGDIEIDPFRSNHVMYVTGATIWGSDDATASPSHWTVRAGDFEETAEIDMISPPAGAHLLTGLGDIGGFRHDDLNVSPRIGMFTNPRLSNTDSLVFAEQKPLVIARVGRGSEGAGGISTDGGTTWKPFANLPPGSRGSGVVALSADASSLVWVPDRLGPYVSTDLGQTWVLSGGGSVNMRVAADRHDPNRFYGLDNETGMTYRSDDGGRNFVELPGRVRTGEHSRFRPAPGIPGDVWFCSDAGLQRSTDAGQTLKRMPFVSRAVSLGFGKSFEPGGYPTLFLVGVIHGHSGIYRSIDIGSSWQRIDDDAHQYGTVRTVVGDPRIFGRVYFGTNGRGVFRGDQR